MQQCLRELGRRQAMFNLVFEAVIEPHSLQEWKPRHPSLHQPLVWDADTGHSPGLLSPAVGKTCDVGQPISGLGETDESREWIWGKTQDKEGAREAQRWSQSAIKCLVDVTRKQMWFDLIAAGPHLQRQTCYRTFDEPMENLTTRTEVQAWPTCATAASALCPRRGLRGTVLFRLSTSQPLDIRCRPGILQVRAVGVMEGPMLSPLVTDSPINKQQVMPLLDIGALLRDEP